MKTYIDLTMKKEQMLLIVLKKKFFLTDDQFCLWQNNGKFTKKNVRLVKQLKSFFKIHQQTNSNYS